MRRTGASDTRTLALAALLLLALQQLGPVDGKCHNNCRERGICISNSSVQDRCQCDNFGGAPGMSFKGPDCRHKTCPTGKAWADFATSNNVAHAPGTVCSNKGHCQEESGECQCATGWSGPACDRTHCPGSGSSMGSVNETVCSGHGRCLSMGELAAEKDDVRSFVATTYTVWDHDMIRGCLCDEGYTGYDCSQRECISGDDPLTTGQVDEVQILECTCLGTCSGSFRLKFRGEWTAAIPSYATAQRLKHELEQLDHIRGVSVTFHGAGAAPNAFVCDADSVSAAITFTHVPGDVPTLIVDKTALASSTATAPVMTVVTAGAGANGGTAATGTKEDVECNNRGYCDRLTGVCTCHAKFASSNGAGAAGSLGDCGFNSATVTTCAGDLVATDTVTEVCNALGTCSGASQYTCSCNSGYEGPTCEFKICPSGVAWFDEATSADTAHTTTVPCSNRGACDRATGACTCQDGFEGVACDVFKCPGSSACSNQGTCYTMSDLATLSEDNGDLRGVTYTTSTATWDATKIKGCDCKIFHHGPFSVLSYFDSFDCSLRQCPTGDDPSTPNGQHEKQTLTCTATGGTFTITFRQVTSSAIAFDATAATFKTSFLEILQQATGSPPYAYAPNDVTVTFTNAGGSTSTPACDGTGVKIEVTFLTHLGDLPPMTVATGSLTGTLTVAETVVGTYENDECANQGICDRKKGICECLPGFDSSDASEGPGQRGDCAYKLPYPNVYPS